MNQARKNQMMSNLIKTSLNNLKLNRSLDLNKKENTSDFASETLLVLNIDLGHFKLLFNYSAFNILNLL